MPPPHPRDPAGTSDERPRPPCAGRATCPADGCASPRAGFADGLAVAARILAEARRWLAHVDGALPEDYASRKALDAVALSVRLHGLRPGGSVGGLRDGPGLGGLIIPTKLVAVWQNQDALRALRDAGTPSGHRLRLAYDGDSGRVGVSDGDTPLGLIQMKHGWLAPLVGLGAGAVLLQVTGGTRGRTSLGVNVALVGLDGAIRASRGGGPPPVPVAGLVALRRAA